MIYTFLKNLIRLTVNSYFRYFRVKGKENIPSNTPIIFVANHPSAFMDPIVVAICLEQKLHFIAAGEFFGKGLQMRFMEKQLHMIPVYRPNTMPGETHKNDEMFNKCYDHLGKGGSILIFPEGNSITEKRLRSIKTGVARIAWGAEVKFDHSLDVHIIPLGLNYSDPHQFRSDLFINILPGIKVNDYRDEALTDKEIVGNITKEVEHRMQQSILHLKDENLDPLLYKLESLYARDLMKTLDVDKKDLEGSFELRKDMITAIEHFQSVGDEDIKNVETKIDKYRSNLLDLGLYDNTIFNSGQRYSKLVLIFGFPVFLLGYLINIIPYNLSRIVTNKLNKTSSFYGSFLMAMGMGIFLVWYIALTLVLHQFLKPSYWALLFPLVAYFSGTFALYYNLHWSRKAQETAYKNLKSRNREKMDEIIDLREEIVKTLEIKRKAFFNVEVPIES